MLNEILAHQSCLASFEQCFFLLGFVNKHEWSYFGRRLCYFLSYNDNQKTGTNGLELTLFFGLHSTISTILAIGIEHSFRFILLLRCFPVQFYDHRGQLLCRFRIPALLHDHREYLTIFYGFIHFNFILRMTLSIVGQTSPPGFMAWERQIEEDKRKISISIQLAFYYDKNKNLG